VVVGGQLAQLGLENHGPQRGAGLGDDGSGGGVGGEAAIPTAHQVGGLAHTRIAVALGAGSVVDGVGKAMAHLLIDFAVDVGLDGQHVGGRELIAAVERFVDALDAVGIGPLVR
jgi:hypothetical protein